MPKHVLTDAFVSVNAVDLSDHVRQVTLNYERETADVTAMGDLTRANAAGLKNWSVDLQFLQDYDASEVDSTIFSLIDGATQTGFVIYSNKTNGISSTNPSYSATALIVSYPPVDGSVANAHETTVRLVPSHNNTTLSRATTT